MIIIILYALTSAALGAVILNRALPCIKSSFLKLSFSWFLGQYVSTWAIYFLCLILVKFTTGVLAKASLLYFSLLAITLASLLIRRKSNFSWNKLKAGIIVRLSQPLIRWKLSTAALCLLFSILLFKNQLILNNGGEIYTSPVYWDFRWHAPLIQNFVLGDNFPPQNESFSNFPHTYHFFWGILTAIHSSLGLNLVPAVNFVSITSFFVLLMGIIGLGEEIFTSFRTGATAALLFVTSSSLHFLNLFSRQQRVGLAAAVKNIILNQEHPYFYALAKPETFGYNGNMFNLFYFVAERQLIIGAIFLIFAVVLLFYRQRLAHFTCLIWGIVLGLFFEWHLFISIMVLSAIIFLFVFGRNRLKPLLILLGFIIPFAYFSFYFRSLAKSDWFYPDVLDFPKINLNYPTNLPYYQFSLLNAAGYYLYGYGFKLIFIFLGYIYLLRAKNKSASHLLFSFLPTFLLVNTVQLSPLSIYDNHKWLRPLNIIFDLITAFVLFKILNGKGLWRKLLFFLAIILLTINGIVELIPYFNTKPTQYFGDLNSPLTAAIATQTPPQSSFLTQHQKEVHLAGRKVFLSDEVGGRNRPYTPWLNREKREKIIANIYSSQDIESFCQLITRNHIDYVEFDEQSTPPIYQKLKNANFKQFRVVDKMNTPLVFVSTHNSCAQK